MRTRLVSKVYKPRLPLKSGGVEKFLGKALWLYPRRGAPVSRHALRTCVDRLECFHQLADADTYSALLRRCGDVGASEEGRRVHQLLARFGRTATPFFANLTMEMYGKLGFVPEASRLFFALGHKRNFHSWSIITLVYARHGWVEKAVHILRWGLLMGFRLNMPMRGILVCVYAQAGHLEAAKKILQEKEDCNAMWWNVLLAAYVDRGMHREALQLALHDLCGKPTSHTYISLAAACGKLEDYWAAKEVHGEIAGSPACKLLADFSSVCCALVEMYARCGRLEDSRVAFEEWLEAPGSCSSTLCCWSLIIRVHVAKGKADIALWLYRRMCNEGLLPDEVTYGALLRACYICGKDEEARLVRARFAAETAYTSSGEALEDVGLEDDESLLLPGNVSAALSLMTTRGWRQLRKAW